MQTFFKMTFSDDIIEADILKFVPLTRIPLAQSETVVGASRLQETTRTKYKQNFMKGVPKFNRFHEYGLQSLVSNPPKHKHN